MAQRAYHHGDLRNGLLAAARTILEEEGLPGLSLRAVARRAGVSHAAPYRHFPSHEALLAELAIEGFVELKTVLRSAGTHAETASDRIANIGGAYVRFTARRPALTRLMFGPQLRHRKSLPDLASAADALGHEIGTLLRDPALGIAVWAAIHGIAVLILENVIDLGQSRSGLEALPSRAEILLRSLFSADQR